MTDVDNLDDLARKIASGLSPNIARYARAQAAATQAQELEIRKLREELDVLKGSGTETRPPSAKPVNTVRPVVTGSAVVGATLTASAGTWTGSPTAYAYQWERGDSGVYTDIPGATGPSYVVASSDLVLVLRVVVTAQNAGGETAAVSDDTAPVTGTPTVFGTALPARLASSLGDGGTIYISPSGSDSTGNGTIGSPYFTLHKAFSVVALTGGLILCRGGTYNYSGTGVGGSGQQQFNRIGSTTNPPQVRAYPAETPVFTNCMVLVGASSTTRGLRFGPGLTIGSGVNSPGFDGFRVEGAVGHVEIVGCTISNVPHGNGLLVSYTSNAPTQVQVWDSVFHHNGEAATPLYHGIYMGASDTTTVIANCVFYDNARFAIQLGPRGGRGIITACTHYGRVGDVGGITIWSQSPYNTNPGAKVYASVVSSVTANYGYSFSGLTNTDAPLISDCVGYNCSPGAVEPQTGLVTSNVVTTDPQFVDVAGRDLRIGGSSSAISLVPTGSYAYLPATDILGNSRITADAGAYAKEA